MVTIEDDYVVIMSMTLRELQKYLIMFNILECKYVYHGIYVDIYDAICARFPYFAKSTAGMGGCGDFIDDNHYIDSFSEAIDIKIKQFIARYVPGEHNISERQLTVMHINPKFSNFYSYREICDTFNCIDDYHQLYMSDVHTERFISSLRLCVTDFSSSQYGNVCIDSVIQLHNLPEHFDYPYFSHNDSISSVIILLPNFNEAMLDE